MRVSSILLALLCTLAVGCGIQHPAPSEDAAPGNAPAQLAVANSGDTPVTRVARRPTELIEPAKRIIELDLPDPLPKENQFENPLLKAIRAKALTGTICPQVNGYHDPTQIQYDEARFWRLIADWNPEIIACGVAGFSMETPAGVVRAMAGLDTAKFGRTFNSQQCIRFLETRAGREVKEPIFIIRGLKPGKNASISVPTLSAWESDVIQTLQLLADAKVADAIPVLAKLTRDRCPRIRQAAVGSLGTIGVAHPDALKALVKATKSSDHEVALAAGGSLAALGAGAVDTLIAALQSPVAATRREAAKALGRQRRMAATAVPALVRLLADQPPEVELAAAVALGEIGESAVAALPDLERVVRTRDHDVRRAAMHAVVQIGPAATPHLEKLLGDPDPTLRATAASALGDPSFGDGVRLLLSVARDDNAYVRQCVATRLAAFPERATEIVPTLFQLLQDPEGSVRSEAVKTAAEMGPPALPTLPALIDILESNSDSDWWGQIAGAKAIGNIGPQAAEAAPALIANLQSPRPAFTAARALGQIGAPLPRRAVPVLMPLLTSAGNEMPAAAAESLQHYGVAVQPYIADLMQLLKNGGFQSRVHAIQILGSIGPAAKAAVPEIEKYRNDSNYHLQEVSKKALQQILQP